MNKAFIIAVFIIFFATLQGWRRGLLGIVYRLAAWILVFIFLAVAEPHICDYLTRETSCRATVYETTWAWIGDKAKEGSENASLQEWYDGLTAGLPIKNDEAFRQFVGDTGLSVRDLGGYQNILQIPYEGRTLQDMLAEEITGLILRCLSYAIAFFVAQIVLAAVYFLFRSVGKMPVVRQVNGLLGLTAGAAEGILIVWLLMFLLLCLSGTAFASGLMREIQESRFLSFLYEHNPITAFFGTR